MFCWVGTQHKKESETLRVFSVEEIHWATSVPPLTHRLVEQPLPQMGKLPEVEKKALIPGTPFPSKLEMVYND